MAGALITGDGRWIHVLLTNLRLEGAEHLAGMTLHDDAQLFLRATNDRVERVRPFVLAVVARLGNEANPAIRLSIRISAIGRRPAPRRRRLSTLRRLSAIGRRLSAVGR